MDTMIVQEHSHAERQKQMPSLGLVCCRHHHVKVLCSMLFYTGKEHTMFATTHKAADEQMQQATASVKEKTIFPTNTMKKSQSHNTTDTW